MPKNWKLKPEIPGDIAHKLSAYPKFIGQLLYNRGLTDVEQIQTFLEPKYENLHSPFLFADMQKAADRIWEAIGKNQQICIYGDYDADAVTANAVLLQTFKYLGVDAESYIPDRFTEGYGINIDALQKIRDSGSKIIITVDCGTNSTDAAEYCAKNNIDLIITDHHEIIGEMPKAYALINPKNTADNYPYRDITGVGVAFKLACSILKNPKSEIRNPKHKLGWEKWLLDLVAIGTVADCHSLLGENRTLVKYGLKVLAKTKWIGLDALIQISGLDFNQKPPDTYTLGFVIAPRLNAAGRLEHANIALHLLMEQDPVAAQQKAVALEEINRRRQDLTGRVLSEAREQALQYQDRKVLVLLGQDWPKGVVGLAAGRIAEEFHKPAIVLDKGELESTGSARTVGEFNVLEAIKHGSLHLIRYGGHQQAAGLTLKTAEYEQFYKKILEYAEHNLSETDLDRQLLLEAELNPEDLQLTTYNLLTKLEPFGVGNPKPKFLIKNLKINSVRLVGGEKQHLQLQLELDFSSRRHSEAENGASSAAEESLKFDSKGILHPSDALGVQDDAKKKYIPAIMFSASDFAKKLKVGDTIDAAAELIRDGWNGREEVKLRIIDLRKVEN
jgi:single-stranded-DNA-specific exonuclease